MKILIGCEESQEVCKAFRNLGVEAYSCDTAACSGGRPEWHLQMDIFEAIEMDDWTCLIAFPPCTHLAVSGAMYFEEKRKDGRQRQAIDFFLKLAYSPIPHIAIENPIGIMSSNWRKPDQIIQPYYFGDEAQKTTCLWLKNLPKLEHVKKADLFRQKTTHVPKGDFHYWVGKTGKIKRQPLWYYEALNTKDRQKTRSKTFEGIAKAMATQWTTFLSMKKSESMMYGDDDSLFQSLQKNFWQMVIAGNPNTSKEQVLAFLAENEGLPFDYLFDRVGDKLIIKHQEKKATKPQSSEKGRVKQIQQSSQLQLF